MATTTMATQARATRTTTSATKDTDGASMDSCALDHVEQAVSASSDQEDEEIEQQEAEEDEGDSGNDEDGADSDGSASPDEDAAMDADEEEEDDEQDAPDAVGFGDAMSKILHQNVGDDAQPILAKRTTARMREIMSEKKEIKKERMSATERRAKERKDNIVPSHAAGAKDRQLRKIATKGVVALFNAIAKHQHQTGKPADKEDKKVKELSKEDFLGLLKSGKETPATKKSSATKPAPTKSTWSVLQDDYMMGAKLKDWDATHSNESRPRRKGADATADGDSDPEATEDKAWKQAATFDSDDDQAASSNKRKTSSAPAAQKKRGGPVLKKRVKRS